MRRIAFIALFWVGIGYTMGFAQDDLSYRAPVGTHSSFSGESPKYEFKGYSKEHELESISAEVLENHFFGTTISKKIYLLDEKYTFTQPVIPGNPRTKTVIRKPAIYQSVRKIEKQLIKKVKDGQMSMEYATQTLDKVLNISLNLLAADTEAFEKELDQTSSVDDKINLFVHDVLIVY